MSLSAFVISVLLSEFEKICCVLAEISLKEGVLILLFENTGKQGTIGASGLSSSVAFGTESFGILYSVVDVFV